MNCCICIAKTFLDRVSRSSLTKCRWYLLLRQRISRKLRRMSLAHLEQCRVSQWKEGLRSEIFSWRVKNFCSSWLNSIIMSAPAPYSLETCFIVFSAWWMLSASFKFRKFPREMMQENENDQHLSWGQYYSDVVVS